MTTTQSPTHAAHWKMMAPVRMAMRWCSPVTPVACPQPSSALCVRNRRKSVWRDSSNLSCNQVRQQPRALTHTWDFCPRAPGNNIQWCLHKIMHACRTLCEGHKFSLLFHRSLLSSLTPPFTSLPWEDTSSALTVQRTKSTSGRRSFQFTVSGENSVWDNKYFSNKSSVFKSSQGIETRLLSLR